MFTGIIEDVGLVTATSPLPAGSGVRALVEAGLFSRYAPALGESIAVDGVCLTAVAIDGSRVAFDIGAETLARTTFDRLAAGKHVNLERAMELGARLSGHLVSGHVDAIGTVAERVPRGDSLDFVIDAPEPSGRYLIEKGSVTVDGISLTVNRVERDRFWVSIIPHTQTATTLGRRQAGERVNLELDLIAKYVERMVVGYNSEKGSSR